MPEVIAENARLSTILETQKAVHQIESQHNLASKLGDILIQGTYSLAALLAVPFRLLKAWREEKAQLPPKELGDHNFEKVIATYGDGGLSAVESLLASVSMSASMRANALTALARSLMHQEPIKAAEIARQAYSVDPRPFRLQWLAFRLYEAGQLHEAEAILEILPPDTHYSDSEKRQVNRLRSEAKQARLREA